MFIAMFKVRFQYNEPNSAIVEVFSTPSIEDAIAFALSFHRSSNVPHLIAVTNSEVDGDSVVFQLRAPKGDK